MCQLILVAVPKVIKVGNALPICPVSLEAHRLGIDAFAGLPHVVAIEFAPDHDTFQDQAIVLEIVILTRSSCSSCLRTCCAQCLPVHILTIGPTLGGL